MKAGRLKYFLDEREKITSDVSILSTVEGIEINSDDVPCQTLARETKFCNQKEKIIQRELDKLLKKEVVISCDHEEREYISTIFLRDKSDGTHRLILNLEENIEAEF